MSAHSLTWRPLPRQVADAAAAAAAFEAKAESPKRGHRERDRERERSKCELYIAQRFVFTVAQVKFFPNYLRTFIGDFVLE